MTVKTTVISVALHVPFMRLSSLKMHGSFDLYKDAKCSFGTVENQLSKPEDK